MSINLFVANINFDATEKMLREYFEGYGEIQKLKIICDRETGQPRGFGFVEFKERKSGETAVNDLNGREFMGRELSVSEARPQKEQQPRWNPSGDHFNDRDDDAGHGRGRQSHGQSRGRR